MSFTGTHEYFVYQKQIIALGVQPRSPIVSDLYCSLKPLFLKFTMNSLALSCLQLHPPLFSLSVPLSLSWFDLPLEIQLEILVQVTPSDLLTLCMVCRDLWFHITPMMHSRLLLCLPPGWSDFAIASVSPWEWAAHMEMLIAIFISTAWFPILSVSFHSWPISQYCLFKFLANAPVTSVGFSGFRQSASCFPLIPYPYMLLPTVKHLSISCYSLGCHSIIGLLSPGMQLHLLDVDCITNGYMVCCPISLPLLLA